LGVCWKGEGVATAPGTDALVILVTLLQFSSYLIHRRRTHRSSRLLPSSSCV